MGFFSKLFGGGTNSQHETLSSQVHSEMKYCPKCGDEYRAEFVECVACGIALIDGSVKKSALKEIDKAIANRPTKIEAGDDVVTLQKGPMKDMKQLKKRLEQHYIPALLASDGVPPGGCCGGPQLFIKVRREDAEVAVHILGKELSAVTHIAEHDITGIEEVFDEHKGDNVCPACLHIFSSKDGACPDCGLSLAVGQ